MTEVRPVEGQGQGLWATRDFAVGEVILDESEPLIQLAPRNVEEEQAILNQQLTVACQSSNSASTDPSESTTKPSSRTAAPLHQPPNPPSLLWQAIQVPSTVPPIQHAKFRGMVQAALCVAHRYLLPKASSTQEHGDGPDPPSLQLPDAFKELYRPLLSSSGGGGAAAAASSTKPNAEQDAVLLAHQAVQYLQAHVKPGSSLEHYLNQKPNSSACGDPSKLPSGDDLSLIDVMLIWSCNAFEGGLVYEHASRINHSCNPNAVVQLVSSPSATTLSTNHQQGSLANSSSLLTITDSKLSSNGETSSSTSSPSLRQVVRAAAPIAAGTPITLSYLGTFLYADTRQRQAVLRRDKHFDCQCDRCQQQADPAAAIPCPTCHPLTSSSSNSQRYQLDEDIQYDDDQTVHYAYPHDPCKMHEFRCDFCHSSFTLHPDDPTYGKMAQVHQSVREKVLDFMLQHQVFLQEESNGQDVDDDDDQEERLQIHADLLEHHVGLASSIMGAKHWTTNLMMLLHLDHILQTFHAVQLSQQTDRHGGGDDDADDPRCSEMVVAQAMDHLDRLWRYMDGLGMQLDHGHLLSHVTIGAARALVSLGDIKSQKFAAEWLDKVAEYVNLFEQLDVQKVVSSLHHAWERHHDDTDGRPLKRGKRHL